MVDTHMANSDNYLRMREFLSQSGWTVLKYKEDSFRKTGKAPSGVARLLEDEQAALLILNERVIGNFHCLEKPEKIVSSQITKHIPHLRDTNRFRKAYLFDGKIPFVYLLNSEALWEIDRINGDQPSEVNGVIRPDDMKKMIKDLAGDSRTLLFPTEVKFHRPSSCKCSSGWVSTKNGGVFDASYAGKCRDCRDLGRYEESQRYW